MGTRQSNPTLRAQSWTRNYIDGSIKPFSFGYSCYRWLAPNEDLAKHEDTMELSKVKGKMVEWNAGQRRALYYPCADHTISNFGAFVPAEERESDGTSGKMSDPPPCKEGQADMSPKSLAGWNNQGSKSHLLQLYSDFAPEVQQILQSVPEGDLKVWDLMDMDSLPTWHKGSLVLIGDAAHPFLPCKCSPEKCIHIQKSC
jgi:salicylate hydroxylase